MTKINIENLLESDKSNIWQNEFDLPYLKIAQKILNQLVDEKLTTPAFDKLFKKNPKKCSLFILETAKIFTNYNFGQRLEEKFLAKELQDSFKRFSKKFQKDVAPFNRHKKFQNLAYKKIQIDLTEAFSRLNKIEIDLDNCICGVENFINSDFSKKRKLNTNNKVKSDFILTLVKASREIFNQPNFELINDLFKTEFFRNKFGETNFESISKLVLRSKNMDTKRQIKK